MQTLSNGYKKPESGDRGSVFFPALEDNIQRLNDHTHNGSNSDRLGATSLIAATSTILAAGWVLASGVYSQTIVMPTGIVFDEVIIQCVIDNGADVGAVFYPNLVKATANTYTISVNDNTLDVTAKYI